ncbi:MAG: hypothetical protein LBC53_09220 [Spirochaetaceae bacterium]|jgi:hypothetical protein|nr:hypothetical protein [Spirochaetaceae bacterium]
MSQVFLYSVRDDLAEQFGPPLLAVNDKVAVRQAVNLLSSSPGLDVTDYSLFKLCSWNPDSVDSPISDVGVSLISDGVSLSALVSAFRASHGVSDKTIFANSNASDDGSVKKPLNVRKGARL